MHILFGLLILAILGVAAIGAREVILPLLIKFITTALIAIILIWLTTALLPWSLIVWLIAAVVCCVQNNYPFAGLYAVLGIAFLLSAYTGWKREKNKRR